MSESLDHITGLILFQKAIAKPTEDVQTLYPLTGPKL